MKPSWRRIATTGLAITAMGTMSAGAAGLTLVVDGRPNAVIVHADSPQAEKAAAEIRTYLEKMSGAQLPMVKDGEAPDAGLPVTIAVGHTSMAAEQDVAIPSGFNEIVGDPKAFEEEGFAIRTGDDWIVLGGNEDGPYQGTIYAAYEFLERLGCRWYFPGEWGEVVPETPTVVFLETDLLTRPDFVVRNVSLGGWIRSTGEEREIYADWTRKIKWTSERFYPGAGDGFLAYLLPPNEYFESNPEYFAMNKSGDRHAGPHRTLGLYENTTMLCLSNPEVFEKSVKNLKAAFAGETESRIQRIVKPNGFGISPPDGTPECHCEDCRAMSQNFDYPRYVHKVQTSEEYFGFASRLAREFPDKWVSTMAYAGREMPPHGVDVPPNVHVNIAPISSCVLHHGADESCWRRSETLAIMRQWLRLTPHVDMYDYNPGFLLGSFLPERDVANFAVNARLYREMGLKGIRAEGRKAFMQTWLSNYVRGKLLWDADADVEAIKTDFYTTFFGAQAGPHIQSWWDAVEAALADTSMHCHEDWLVNHVYTVPFTTAIRRHVEAAAGAAMTPEQQERFEAFRYIAEHLEAFARMEAAEMNLDYATAAAEARRMQDLQNRLHEIHAFFINPDLPHREFVGGRAQRYAEKARQTNGEAGRLVEAVPLESRFRRDMFNEGIIRDWWLPDFDDGDWALKNTFYTWDAQDKPLTERGHDYDGYGWYRMTMDIPADLVEAPLRLHLGGVLNEGWVWINGHYAGHRPWVLWWAGTERKQMNVDVTGMVQEGPNVVAIRVWNDAEIGGLFRRGFLWSPNETDNPPPED